MYFSHTRKHKNGSTTPASPDLFFPFWSIYLLCINPRIDSSRWRQIWPSENKYFHTESLLCLFLKLWIVLLFNSRMLFIHVCNYTILIEGAFSHTWETHTYTYQSPSQITTQRENCIITLQCLYGLRFWLYFRSVLLRLDYQCVYEHLFSHNLDWVWILSGMTFNDVIIHLP